MSRIYTLKRIIEVHLELCEWINCWNVFEVMTQSIYLNEFYPLPKVYVSNDAFTQFLEFLFRNYLQKKCDRQWRKSDSILVTLEFAFFHYDFCYKPKEKQL